MTAAGSDILLLADLPLSQRLRRSMPEDANVETADPFGALEALSNRTYRAVIIALPQPDLPKLLQAIQRLQPGTPRYGLCTPAGEHELRRLAMQDSSLLEDYFIIPPSDDDWRRMIGVGESLAEPEAPASGLTDRQMSDLVESTRGIELLADRVASMVAEACGVAVSWSRKGEPRKGIQQLLTLDDEPGRTLWAAEVLDDSTDCTGWLSSLRAVLPSLASAARRADALRRLAVTDDLTGAHNRRYFLHMARRMLEISRARRMRATLLVYDIDDFKHYNDEYGHAAGDEILRETAKLMTSIVRKHDLVARIGGDEFAVLFCELSPARQPGSQPVQSAHELANRFREAVIQFPFKSLGPNATGKLTISGGLAAFPWDGNTIEQLLASADEALLSAKRKGKNNIYLVGEEIDQSTSAEQPAQDPARSP